MRYGQLSDYFVGVGVKRLTAVDTDPGRSNQHEVGTTQDMRDQFLGKVHREQFTVVYVWLGQDQDGFTSEGTATHYDARKQQAHRRPEWRLYYPSNPVTEAMGEGDTLFLAMDHRRLLYFIVASRGSTSERQLSWLFGLHPEGRSFVSRGFIDDGSELDFAARFILDEIGIEFEDPEADKLDTLIERFGMMFPSTREFSDLARLTLPEARAEDDPDAALVAWLSHEGSLFRRLERKIVEARLGKGFLAETPGPGRGTAPDNDDIDVDSFLKFSLSVQNRRKSRMGHSLENHLEAVFRACGVAHVRGAITENNQKPDFLFPGIEAYRAAPHGHPCLTMLGAKSTCKDRWRQVLAEASKIPRKHLLTLEPGISEPQTAQMENSDLQLVVPESIQASYTEDQRAWLWNLGDFIRDARVRAGSYK